MDRPKKKPWVTNEILELCDKRRELKKKKADPEIATQYREAHKEVQKGMKRAKQNWIDDKLKLAEDSLENNNSKEAYGIVKELTNERQSRTSTIQDKNGKNLTEENQVLGRWTEYCSELYNHDVKGDPSVLNQ